MNKIGFIGANIKGLELALQAAKYGYEVAVYDKASSLTSFQNQFLEGITKLEMEQNFSPSDAKAIFGRLYLEDKISILEEAEIIFDIDTQPLEIRMTTIKQLVDCQNDNSILVADCDEYSITSYKKEIADPFNFLGIVLLDMFKSEVIEIIKFKETTERAFDIVNNFLLNIGKKTITVKDTPGFVLQKIMQPFFSESMRMEEEQTADIYTIDCCLKTYGSFVNGPFEMMDNIGLDIVNKMNNRIWKGHHFDARYRPFSSLKLLLDEGYLGVNSGRGFYSYPFSKLPLKTDENLDALGDHIANRVICMILNESADTLFRGYCQEEDIDVAMTFGLQLPKSFSAWVEEISVDHIIYTLDNLYDRYHEERYRVSPYFRDRTALM
jgi:3-hydroxybutyryl-CoA dehydrogenase